MNAVRTLRWPGLKTFGGFVVIMSQIIPPPRPAIRPMKIAGTGLTPKASAFFAPVTPKRLSAAASQINSSTASRESRRARSATRIAEIRAAMMNQGFDIEVGTWLSRMSRRIPPPTPVKMPRARMPAASNLALTPISAPKRALAVTARRSNQVGIVSWVVITD